MAFTVEDGTGLAAANSYALVATLASHFADVYGITLASETPYTTVQKQSALVQATAYLDGAYGALFAGFRSTRAQGLEWPRYSAFDTNGQLITEASVPIELVRATCEAAKLVLADGVSLVERVTGKDVGISSVSQSLGPMSLTKQYGSVSGGQPIFPTVHRYLARILTSQGRTTTR